MLKLSNILLFFEILSVIAFTNISAFADPTECKINLQKITKELGENLNRLPKDISMDKAKEIKKEISELIGTNDNLIEEINKISETFKKLKENIEPYRRQFERELLNLGNVGDDDLYGKYPTILNNLIFIYDSIETVLKNEYLIKPECYIEEGVELAISMKEKGYSTSAIIDIINSNPKYQFANAYHKLNESQLLRLKTVFPDETEIKNWYGTKQRVTIGAAPILLFEAKKIVAAGVIRVLLTPRNFYTEINAFPYPLADNPNELSWWSRWDFNLGLTTAASEDDTSNSKTDPFALLGFSYEIHREAHLVFGLAAQTTNIKDSKQWFMGITLDQNTLKAVGFTK